MEQEAAVSSAKRYAYSYDEARFEGSFDSREAAEAEGRSAARYGVGTVFVGEIEPFQPDYRRAVDIAIDLVVEDLREQAQEACGEHGEDYLFDTIEVIGRLAPAVTAAVEKILGEQDAPGCFAVTDVRQHDFENEGVSN